MNLPRMVKMSRIAGVALSVLLAPLAHADSASGIVRLTPDLGESKSFDTPDGTHIKWAEFFSSPTSHVSVGRSDVDGPLMKEKLTYTDVFYVAGGSMVLSDGKKYKRTVRKGTILILPRGIAIEGRDIKHYVHYAASFESQPNDTSNGPREIRELHPEKLKDADFSVAGPVMRHVYYQGAGGVVVRAWQATKPDISTEYSPSPWSELFFVVSGSGSLTPRGGTEEKLAPGDVFFVPKGAVFKFTGHELRKVAVVFDQASPSPTR